MDRNFTRLIVPVFCFTIFASSQALGQTGPGGIDENDGSSSLELWLQGNIGVEEAASDPAEFGDNVENWLDQSGNGNDLQHDFGINPTYSNAGGQYSIDFSVGSAYLRRSAIISGTGARTLIMVVKPSSISATTSNCAVQLAPNESAGRGYGYFTEGVGASNGLALRVSGNKVMNYTTSTFTPTIFSVQNGASENVTDAEFYANGSAQTTLVTQSANVLNTSNLGITIGGFSSDADNDPENTYDFNGDIYEVITYSKELNDAERIIIENYLGAKYNLNPANDYYTYEVSHGNHVVGIGQEGGSSHLNSQSNGTLRLSNASSVDANGDFLFIGHDSADVTTWTSTESPDGTNVERLAREWRVSENGDVGTVSLSIDTSTLPVKSAGFDFYLLWVDADGDFSSGAVAYPVTLNGDDEYEAVNVDLSQGDHIMISTFRPSITLDMSSSNDLESNTSPSIGLSTNYAASRNISLDVNLSGSSTATEGALNDFTYPSSITITAGNNSANLVLNINNDVDVESDETVIIDISNPSSGVVSGITTHTFSINDDDNPRKIDFQSASASGDESVNTVSVIVEINSVDPVNPTTVEYSVSGGTATGSGTDFTLASGTATIAATTTSTTLNISIVDDLLDEVDETIVITLANPSNANLGTDLIYTYTITDNDAQPDVEFLNTSSFGYEDLGSGAIIVSLTSPSGQDITVDYAVTGGDATGSGTDYTLNAGTLTISAGDLTGNINLSITDDGDVENQETIELTLSNPTGATLGSNTVHTLSIIDNENSGFTGPGGIGATDGNSELELWLRGDLGVEEAASDDAEVGDNVEFWRDQSGNTKDVQHDFGINPTYDLTGSIYGIDFSGGSAYLRGSSVITGTSARTMVVVAQPSSLTVGTSNCAVQLAPNEAAGMGYSLFTEGVGASNGLAVRVSGNKVMNYTTSTSDPTIFSVQSGVGSNVTDTRFYTDGTEQTTLVTQSAAALNTSSLGSIIGGFSSGADNDPENIYDFDGTVYEVIAFSKELNDAERIIVENYLSSKYGKTISNDHYNFDNNNGSDVAGIGQEGTDINNAAMSGGIVGISGASSLDVDGDYLLFGHDNGDISTWSTTDAPNSGSNTFRVAREWRFDESGDIGDVNILIDTSDLPSKPVGFDQYVVWVDDNGLFEDGATQFELTLVGDYYQVAGVDIANGDFVTIGIVRPTVEFTDLNSNGSETSNAAIEVSINYPISSDLTVDYSITGGTASGSGVDYLLNSGTATILAGQTTATINPSIINDTDIESDETISITITNPSSGFLGTNTTHIYTINDDDNLRKIDFTASSTAGNEGTSPVTLTIQINSVDGVNPTTVDYAVTGGTAVGSGTDFTLSSGTATINAGNTTTTFDITITDDLLNEADETIIISLSNPTNSNLGTNQVYTYTINDDDAQPSIEFLTSSSFGYEDAVNASIFVSLSAVSGQDVTVDYTISGGTASGSGVDYNLSNGTAIISAGNLTETIDLTIIDDAISESPETIELTLSAPSGATLGATTVHTMTINDNENDGFTGPGGVGAVDGSSALELWLRSDTDVEEAASDPAEVGDNVEIWKDQSGNGKDVQNDFGSNPTYDLTGSTYGIDFSGGSAYLRGSSVISGTSARTMVVVAKPSSLSATSSNCAVQLAPNEGAGMGYSLFLEDVGASSGLAVRVSGNKVMNYTTGTADPTIFSVQSGVGSNVTDTRFYTDGTEQTTLVIQSAAALNTSTLGTIIGGFSSGADNIPENTFDFNGLVYEVIAFSKELNDAERVIIENYVGAKYNESIANDFYSHEGSQGFDVSGIGQEGTDVHTAAMSAQILGVSGASSLDTDGDYLLFGHDNGDVTTWVTTEAPNSGVNTFRIAREWQFDESGTIGSVNVMIDSNNVPVKPAGYTQYVVWVDADGDFSNGATQHELSLIGDYYQASGLTIADNSYITVGVVRPTIEFAQTTSNGFETTNPTIDVSISYAIGEDVTVDYTVSGGTATGSGVDYTLNSGTVTILAGQTTASISPSIINDTDIESDETIVITVFNPSHGVLGTDITHTYTINDDDNLRKIDFNSNNSSGLESVTPINITIEINNIDIVNPTTVDYAVTGGTAVGTDYTLASGTATIPASSSSTSISLVINEDLLDESDETVIISLSNPTNSNLGTDITYTYTIQDNDASPTVQFNSTASSGSESSSPGLIVELDATSGQDVTVDYAVTGGDATGAGTDYTLNSGTLTILTGNSSENIFISITDDPDIELPETIEVTISNPSNASLGGNTVHTYTILDNDNVGFKGPGGVGSIDGSSTLEVWLKADEGVEEAASDDAEVGDNIEFWRDQSGNANDVENDLGANPVYRQNSGIYSADFSGGSAYLRSNSAFSGTGARTVFTVAKPSSISATTSNCVYQLAPNEAAGMGYGIFYEGVGASNGLALRVSGNKVVNYTVSTANPNIISVQNGANENVTDAEFYADGTAQTTLVTQSANTLNTSSIGVVVGGFAVGATNVPNSTYDFNGDIYEIIVYSEEMSNSKRIIVENYLGAKYGVTVANERYTENQGTVYSFDVAGIGHEGGSDYHEVSESAGILKVSNPTSLASGDYLMFGHDDASIAAWTTTEAPSANEERLAREWYFEETNEVGTVTITIDTTLLPSRNAGFNKFLLYVDTDGDFSSGSTSYVLEDAGGPLFSVDVNISDGDYVAIGAVKYITQVDGDWDQAATWEGGIVPGSEDDAVITSNHVVDLTQNETIGSLSIASDATLNIGSHTLTIDDGCLTLGANATVTMTTGTIRYTKNGDQCVTGNTTNFPSYANLSLEGSNTKTLNGDISVTGALSIDNNVILDVFAGNDYNITLSGNLDNNGTFLEQEGDFTFNGSSNQLITGGSEANFYNLNISNTGGAVQPSVDLDVNGNLTILAGTGVLDANTNSIDVELAGNWVNNNGAGGFLEGTNFVTFNGSSNQNITNSSGSEDYYDLIVSNTGGAVQPTSDLDIANNLSINSGTAVLDLNTNSADLEISGSWINNNGLSGLVGSNQTVTFDNAVTVSILGSPTLGFGNLNISNTSGSVRTGANVEVSGNLVISATGILDAATNSNSVSIGGNWTNNNGTDGFAESNTTVIFNGSSNQSISNNLGTEVFNNLSIENTGGQVQPTTVIDINGDLTINGTGVLNLSTSGVDLQISGNWTSSNGAGFIPGNQTVTFDNSSNVQISNTSGTETFNNLNISNTSGAVVTNANLDLSGNLNIIAASGILNVLTNGNNIFLEGNWTNNNGAGGFLEGSQRVTFNGTSNQSINSSTPETFYDLNIDNNGAEVRPTVNLSILNDLDISATGVLNASVSSVDLSIAGNWTNLNGASGFNQGTESVTFSGSGASQISNASGEEFYDLVINKSSNNVTINNEITISSSGSLTLTSGDVVCGANIVLNSSSNIVGGSSSSYVQTNGSAIRKMLNANGTYQFPIGDNSNYSPITFDLNNGSLSSAFVDVSVTNSPHPNRAGATAYLNRYWTINQSGISGSIDYDVSFVYLNGDIVGSESVYFPGKWDGANWISVGSVNTGTNTVSMPGLTTFSDFTAMDNTDSPLPVELADYKVNLIENNDVKVSWSTLAEINNEKFEIYRTVDTLEYEHIGSVSGNANSNQLQDYEYIDRDPHLGQSYYRLVQIDFSGDTTYYELKPIFILDDFEEQNWSIYPNPSNGEFTLKGNKLKPNSEYRVSIFDNLSLLHYQRIFTTDQGGNILVQDPIHHEYAPGVYHMIIENPDGVTEIEIVIN